MISKKIEKINIMIETCHPDAVLPKYARYGDSGMDIYAVEDTVIPGNSTRIVGTGLKIAIPVGFELQVRPRSGLSLKTPLRIANSPGTIDAGYRDEIGIIVENIANPSYRIIKGDRIAQLVLQEIIQVEWVPIKDITVIGENRGGGFGHTGK